MKFFLVVFAFLPYAVSCAQVSNNDSAWKEKCLYREFIHGSVLMKNGSIESALLNYNTEDQSIIFLKDNQIMTLVGLETVDTVYIKERKFIPANDIVYEVKGDAENACLYITYSNRLQPLIATTDHSGSSQQALSKTNNTVTDTYVGRSYKGNYSVEILKHYWIKKGGNLYKIDSEKPLLKMFPSKIASSIKEYIQENKINFKSDDDLLNLISAFNGQLK